MNRGTNIKTKVKTASKSTAKKVEHKRVVVENVREVSETTKPEPDIIFSYQAVDDRNVLAIIETVRNGLSYKDFNKIAHDTPFSLGEWANYLQLSERTIQRNQKEEKPFQPIQSERIIELSMLYKYGVEVFGDKENFNIWLNYKSISLGGRTPKDLLDTKFGISLVRDELGRIEHGILA